MGRAEKHPTDEGKYQSTFDTYGHGEGQGKSRAAVYKHFKKNSETVTQKLSKNEKVEEDDYTKTDLNEKVEEDDYTKTDQFSDISWLSDEELDAIMPSISRRRCSRNVGCSKSHTNSIDKLGIYGNR